MLDLRQLVDQELEVALTFLVGVVYSAREVAFHSCEVGVKLHHERAGWSQFCCNRNLLAAAFEVTVYVLRKGLDQAEEEQACCRIVVGMLLVGRESESDVAVAVGVGYGPETGGVGWEERVTARFCWIVSGFLISDVS